MRNRFEGPERVPQLRKNTRKALERCLPSIAQVCLACHAAAILKEKGAIAEKGSLGANSVLLKSIHQTFNNQHLPFNTALKRRLTWWDRGQMFASLVNTISDELHCNAYECV